MPAPPKTNDAEIIRAARGLVEAHGPDGFSMKDVAAAVGIQAPSLYGRFRDRASLIAAIEVQVCVELAKTVKRAAVAGQAETSLLAQARAIRRYVRKNPKAYSLIFDVRSVRTEEGTKARAAALAPLMPALIALAGEENALDAARVFTPFIHGFVSLELANAFRLGGKLDAAYDAAIATIIRGLARHS